VTERLSPATHAAAVALASLALNIRGSGHIKLKNYRAVKAREAALLRQLRSPPPTVLMAAG
jgi:indolepyruvate ferredoxin oxidoreductase